jgi:hypothetical protein
MHGIFIHETTQNAAAEWWKRLLPFQENLNSNLGPKTGRSDWELSLHSSLSRDRIVV